IDLRGQLPLALSHRQGRARRYAVLLVVRAGRRLLAPRCHVRAVRRPRRARAPPALHPASRSPPNVSRGAPPAASTSRFATLLPAVVAAEPPTAPSSSDASPRRSHPAP